jgi:hypothetical protein
MNGGDLSVLGASKQKQDEHGVGEGGQPATQSASNYEP